MTELKPCPFCGCEVKIVIGIYGIHGALDYYTIVHPEIGCIMDEFACYSTDNKDELIEDWNKRVEMKNLLKETNLFFKINGLNWEDVKWIEDEGEEIPIEKFKEVASHTYYDSGCGSQVISPSLHIVGEYWVMFREEYDGAEWWRLVKTIRPTRECKIVDIGMRG